MGYFPNGTEGMCYQAEWCQRCIHDKNNDCPVWMAHMLYNYDQLNENPDQSGKLRDTLLLLIPERPDHLGNEQCKMFIEIK